jgi:hypothetical protein
VRRIRHLNLGSIEDWQSLELRDRRDVLDEAKRSAQPGARAIITADLVAV